jgi:transposase-like protein
LELTRFGGQFETGGLVVFGRELLMPKPKPPYPAEYRQRILGLARQGRSAWSLAREFEPTGTTIRSWIRQAGIDAGEFEGVTSDERAELVRLRREVAVLREEKEILAKAAAWFAEETGRTPRGRSSS